jgi:multiple sugar transport system substrate-binding protein
MFDVAPLPVVEGNDPVGTLGGWQLAVSAYSENQDAAWEYVKYVTSFDQQFADWEAGALARPAQVGALDEARANAEGIIQEHLEVSLAQAETGYTWPLFPQFAEIQPILWGEIERVLSNQAEPQEALDRAAQEAERIFERDGLI